ncbi:unnamed protein product [Gadus morhua 'NCC']
MAPDSEAQETRQSRQEKERCSGWNLAAGGGREQQKAGGVLQSPWREQKLEKSEQSSNSKQMDCTRHDKILALEKAQLSRQTKPLEEVFLEAGKWIHTVKRLRPYLPQADPPLFRSHTPLGQA